MKLATKENKIEKKNHNKNNIMSDILKRLCHAFLYIYIYVCVCVCIFILIIQDSLEIPSYIFILRISSPFVSTFFFTASHALPGKLT